MEQTTKKNTSVWAEIEPWCVLHRIWKSFWMVLMSAALFALGAYIFSVLFLHPSYTCVTTFAVTPKYNSSASAAGGAAVTAGTADQFATLLSSSTLTQKVRKDYGSQVNGVSVRTTAVENTSLIQMTVSGPTPSSAYYMSIGILDHYEEYSQYIFNSVMLDMVSAPTIPGKQGYAATQKRMMVVAAPLGALVMIGLLALLTIISGTVQTVTGARRQIDAPLLVTLNHQRKHRTLKSRLTRRKSALLISDPTTSFLYMETIHQLRSRVEHAKRHHNCKTLLITSVSENEGKSTVASNLALSLARRNKKVLLVDSDLRKSAQHLIFDMKLERSKTLNTLLRESLDPAALTDAICYRKSDNLFCLFASGGQRHSAELLGSEQMRQILDILRESFDYVLIDSSPLGYFTDSEVLADQADASLLVVRQDRVKDLSVNDAIDALRRCSARFLGFVFNDVHTLNLMAAVVGGAGSYGYGYGYGKGYGYGYGYGKGYGYGYGYAGRKPSQTLEEPAGEEDLNERE